MKSEIQVKAEELYDKFLEENQELFLDADEDEIYDRFLEGYGEEDEVAELVYEHIVAGRS